MMTMFEKMLREDLGFGDITSELTVPEGLEAKGMVTVKEDCVVSGLGYLSEKVNTFGLDIDILIKDGEDAKKGDVVAVIKGNARKMLLVERVFINILGRMSGIATTTRRIVDKVRKVNSNVRIAATRKTLMGRLDKIAVIIGGGDPHRWNLSDHVLIKDNHIALVGLEEAVKRAKKTSFVRKIEVEVVSPEDAVKIAKMGVDIILLDNFKPLDVYRAIELLNRNGLRNKVMLEVSGGINEGNITDYARCDIDVISMGSLTHSTKSVDFSLEIQPA
jgi:nicotinate-nucleotide pyrophosphorylase (carboxylating)